MKKIPYMLVVGAKEEEEGKVSVRSRFAGDEGQCGLEEFMFLNVLIPESVL